MHISFIFSFPIEHKSEHANWQEGFQNIVDHVIRYRPCSVPMRLRIQTYNPLPEIKAWFIPDVQSVPESVYDLKEALCLRFQALKACKFSSEDLVLLLDDFELLNDTPFSAVRDGDLICVKLSPLAQVEDVVETELGQFFFVYLLRFNLTRLLDNS